MPQAKRNIVVSLTEQTTALAPVPPFTWEGAPTPSPVDALQRRLMANPPEPWVEKWPKRRRLLFLAGLVAGSWTAVLVSATHLIPGLSQY